MRFFVWPFLILSMFCTNVCSQDSLNNSDAHYKQIEERYKRLRDSLLLLHPFIPAVSSVVLKHNQIEIILYNSLITANRIRNNQGEFEDLDYRVSYFYSTLQFTYGISKKSRFNFGFDVNTITGRIDIDRTSSPFKVFSNQTADGSRYSQALTSFGPRVRFRPFKGNYNFTVQSSISFPAGISSEKEKVLGINRIYFILQGLYNQPLSKRLFLFTQLSFQYAGQKENNPAIFVTPLSAYLSFLIPKRFILFVLFNYVPIFTDEKGWNYGRYTFQLGGGAQYQISTRFLINAYYTKDLIGKNYQGFNNYNISLRYASR